METARLHELVSYDASTGKLAWRVDRCATVKAGREITGTNKDGYIQVLVDGEFFYGHRLAWQLHYGVKPEFEVDHRNGVRSDNRIENLRIASSSQNGMNSRKRKDNSSGVKGVCWSKRINRWIVRINANRQLAYSGCFDNLLDAAAAAYSAREQIHREFSNHG